MTLDLLVRAGLPDDVAVESRRERSLWGASGRTLTIVYPESWAVIEAGR